MSTEVAMYSDEDNQNNEDWMTNLPEELWDVPLSSLAIPGSHDAMSYSLDINSPLIRSESDTFRLLDGLFYCLTRPAIYRWSTTQEKGIVEQLSEGIRYFDLRIAHKPYDPSNELYFTHVIYTHLTVVETVVTLRGLWALGYQVLLSYDDQSAARHQALWPGIPYWWANQYTASGVVSYLDWQKDMGRPDGFFVSGLNLTADRSYIALHPRQSLQTLTLANWKELRPWLEEQVPGPHPNNLNIIAGDFIGPVPFCPLVINLNRKLLRQQRMDERTLRGEDR
ncbi:PI-PLC X domain-containing protein 1 isoform X3 [Oncorhynchus mykiss]|uniref:PI-PLC X domain-containing protein 1 isoform X3 n=1 Tax=Oncorhynchus mykiss TaxID=8022 RepID=UPI001878D59D|nr:PI-PLC X domain-containing protein 1 isoform X3 [Oncorhynchus mykiss]